MNLREFIGSGRLTQEQFANRCGVSQGMVSHWVTGKRLITAERAKQIEAATGGAVTRHDLRPDLFDPPATAETEATA